jgi:DNA-binding MarR family transcriptional regulator
MLYVAYQKSGQLVAAALDGTAVAAEDAPLYNVLDREGPMTLGELARALGMAPSTLTYRLRALVERGHVTRTRNPADGRSAHVRLSARGRRVWATALPRVVGATRAAEQRLAIPQHDVGLALEALTAAIDAELAFRARLAS